MKLDCAWLVPHAWDCIALWHQEKKPMQRVTHNPVFNSFFSAFQVSETERLSYVGNNFSSGVLKSNSLCRYEVTGEMGAAGWSCKQRALLIASGSFS